MQYSNNPTLHRYLPTRAILLAELEALRADAMSRQSKLDVYGLTPLRSDNENLVFAKENMVAVTAEIALLTEAIVATGLGVASSLPIHPLHAAATMLHPEFGRFAYIKDDSVRAHLLSDGEEMLRALAQKTAEGQKEAAVAVEKEAADKEAAAREAVSGCISSRSSKGAARTTGGSYGLLLSHSVNEDDVVVADKRDEVARMLQYKPTPQQLQKLRSDLSDDGDPLVLYWHGMRSTFPQLYAVALRVLAVHPSQSESERNFSGAGKTLTGERSSLSSLRVENEICIRSFLLGQRKKRQLR
jgi:hAT family C-terminal dimerisation region